MTKEGTKTMFNRKAYEDIIVCINKIEDQQEKSELHELVEMSLINCIRYVERVDAMELAMPRLLATCAGAEFRDRVESLDNARKATHDAAIAQAVILNRLAKQLGVDKICLADTKDRFQVGDYCIDVVDSIFKNRKK